MSIPLWLPMAIPSMEPYTWSHLEGQHLDTRPVLFKPGAVSVVMHLRRADLERSDTRATPDSYYYRLAKEGMAMAGDSLEWSDGSWLTSGTFMINEWLIILMIINGYQW